METTHKNTFGNGEGECWWSFKNSPPHARPPPSPCIAAADRRTAELLLPRRCGLRWGADV
jgi:hypothetical protein